MKYRLKMLDRNVSDKKHGFYNRGTYRDFIIESCLYFDHDLPDFEDLTEKSFSKLVKFYNSMWSK